MVRSQHDVVRAFEARVQLRVSVPLHVLREMCGNPAPKIQNTGIGIRRQHRTYKSWGVPRSALHGREHGMEATHTERFAREPQAAFRAWPSGAARAQGGAVGTD